MRHAGLLLLALPIVVGCRPREDSRPPTYPPPTYPPPTYPPPGQWIPPPPPQSPPPPAFPPPAWQLPPGGFPFPFPIPGWGAPPSPFPAADPAQRCVDLINQHRQTLRLPPLARWFPAEACAASQARDDAATGRAHGSFGRCGELAQNVCPDWAGSPDQIIGPCLQTMWNEGPGADFSRHGHYINMSSTRFTRVACGYFTTPSGSTWSVQDFQ